MMYPDWQYWYWLRSVFLKKVDFVYRDEKSGKEVKGSWANTLAWLIGTGVLVGGAFVGREWVMEEMPRRLRDFDPKMLIRSATRG